MPTIKLLILTLIERVASLREREGASYKKENCRIQFSKD
jgi:hypothetical protein